MGSAYFYTDESGSHTRGRYLVIAGIALVGHHNAVRAHLYAAEEQSRKGKRCWAGTDARINADYLSRALDTELLAGRVFYQRYRNASPTWDNTVDALALALKRFGDRGRRCILAHEGFGSGTRKKLERALRGLVAEVRSGQSERRPEIRLADPQCVNYIRDRSRIAVCMLRPSGAGGLQGAVPAFCFAQFGGPGSPAFQSSQAPEGDGQRVLAAGPLGSLDELLDEVVGGLVLVALRLTRFGGSFAACWLAA